LACVLIVAGSGLAPAAVQTSAPIVPAPAAVDQTPKQAALRLAAILYAEESQVAIAERMADTEIASVFRRDPNFQEIEAEFPGFTDAVLKEMKPALVRFTRQSIPSYHDRIATLIASRLTVAEIVDLTKFYQTPTGQKLVKGMQANVTTQAMIGEIVKDPDAPTSYSAIAEDHKAATDATKKLIDSSDTPALMEFAKKPYFTKVAALGPAMRKLEQDFSNEPAPEFDAEVEAIVNATFARFEAMNKR
jgi:hypothetical protein